MRCTQNPTKGEEWRKGWHPERIAPKDSDDAILIIGAGPAGLEAARATAERGYNVTLAEASDELGGRVTRESNLPGLSAWGRVRDYRVHRIQQMANVEIFQGSELDAAQVLEFGANQVAIATGAHWRKDGYGSADQFPIPGTDGANVFTPDDVMDGVVPAGPVVVYDDEHYYMGAVMAEKLRGDGLDVVLVTTDSKVSSWTDATLEQHRIQARVIELGIEIVTNHRLSKVGPNTMELACLYSGQVRSVDATSVVMVTSRLPNDALFHALMEQEQAFSDAGLQGVKRIGDCYGPSIIAAAVYEGHRFARELDTEPADIPYRRELTEMTDGFKLP